MSPRRSSAAPASRDKPAAGVDHQVRLDRSRRRRRRPPPARRARRGSHVTHRDRQPVERRPPPGAGPARRWNAASARPRAAWRTGNAAARSARPPDRATLPGLGPLGAPAGPAPGAGSRAPARTASPPGAATGRRRGPRIPVEGDDPVAPPGQAAPQVRPVGPAPTMITSIVSLLCYTDESFVTLTVLSSLRRSRMPDRRAAPTAPSCGTSRRERRAGVSSTPGPSCSSIAAMAPPPSTPSPKRAGVSRKTVFTSVGGARRLAQAGLRLGACRRRRAGGHRRPSRGAADDAGRGSRPRCWPPGPP